MLSALSLFGVLSPVPTADSMAGLETSGVDATYAQELVAYTIKVTDIPTLFSTLSWLFCQLSWLL